MPRIRVAIFVCVASLLAATAYATPILNGQVVQTTYMYPDMTTVWPGGPPVNTTVGPTVELINFAGLANIDFSDTNILITLTRDAGINNVPFDGFRFVDIFGTIPDNLNVTINPATNYPGFTAARLAGGDKDTLFVNVVGLPGLQGQIISLDLALPTAPAVPEPASMLLLATGLIGIGAQRRRNRTKRA